MTIWKEVKANELEANDIIKVESVKQKRLKILLHDQEDSWCFEVTDNFNLNEIHRQLLDYKTEWVLLKIEDEELLIRPCDIYFIDLGYELDGIY